MGMRALSLIGAALGLAGMAQGAAAAVAEAPLGDNVGRFRNRQRQGKGRGYQGRDYSRVNPGSIATGNRHGGPHEHLRERARRLHPPGERRQAYIRAETGRGAR